MSTTVRTKHKYDIRYNEKGDPYVLEDLMVDIDPRDAAKRAFGTSVRAEEALQLSRGVLNSWAHPNSNTGGKTPFLVYEGMRAARPNRRAL